MSELRADKPQGVRTSLGIAIRAIESWRDMADGIASVKCNMTLPCDEIIEHPSGWRESANERLTVEIIKVGPRVPQPARPPKPAEPQLRLMKEGHIPPASDDFGSTAANPDGSWLWPIIASVLSFLAGVGFAEWIQ